MGKTFRSKRTDKKNAVRGVDNKTHRVKIRVQMNKFNPKDEDIVLADYREGRDKKTEGGSDEY